MFLGPGQIFLINWLVRFNHQIGHIMPGAIKRLKVGFFLLSQDEIPMEMGPNIPHHRHGTKLSIAVDNDPLIGWDQSGNPV